MTRPPTWPAVLVLLCSDCTNINLCPSGSIARVEEDSCTRIDGGADDMDGRTKEPVRSEAPSDGEDVDDAPDDRSVSDAAREAEPANESGPISDSADRGGENDGDAEEPAEGEEAGVDARPGATSPGDGGGAPDSRTPGDGDGDGRSDLALTCARDMDGVPTALSKGDGTFRVVESVVPDFPTWAAGPGVQPVPGDFDGDGRRDIALLGAVGSSTISFAFSKGAHDGFRVDQCEAAEFAAWAQIRGNRPVSGDFDGDGLSDIAMVGASGARTIPVAFLRAECAIEVTNFDVVDFPVWAAQPGAQSVSGDFDGDRRWDIALTGMAGAWTVPVAFSRGDGRFVVTNADVADFPDWAQVNGNLAVPGDFNGDGRGDIALTGAPGSWSIAVALSRGDGGFDVTNAMLLDFPTWAARPAARPVPGDFDHDGCGDIALVGASGATTLPLALSECDGSFRITNAAVEGFTTWAQQPGMRAIGGY